MVAIRKNIDALYRGMCYFFAFSLAFPNNLSVWVFSLWGLLFLGRKMADIIGGNRKVFAPRERRYLPSLLLFSLSLLGLLSACYAEDSHLVIHRIFGTKLSLLVMPLFALMDDEEWDFSAILRWFIIGNCLFIAYSLAVVSYKYWVALDIELHRNVLRYFTEICNNIVHRTYSGVNILLSYVALYYLVSHGKMNRRGYVLAFSYLCFSMLFLMLNNSRVITLTAMFLGCSLGVCYLLKGKKNSLVVILAAVGVFVALFAFLPSRSKEILKSDHFIEFLKQDPRARIWPSALDLALEKPWLGYGVNNVTKRLTEKYRQADFMEGVAESYGPHNEYLNTWLQLGLGGVILFLILLCSLPFCAAPKKKQFALLFMLVMAAVFLTESMLDRYNGSLTFAFFIALLAKRDGTCVREFSVGKVSFTFLALLMFLPSLALGGVVFRSNMFQGEVIIKQALFEGESPYAVQASDVTSFIHDGCCKSYISVGYCELPEEVTRQFKIDCNVSADFDASTVKIIAEEDMPDGSVRPTECKYDMTQKANWQELSVEVRGKRTVNIYIFGEGKISYLDLKGEAFFKNPRFVTN